MKQNNKLNLHITKNWHGVWTALITPIKKKGKTQVLDVDSLERLIEFQISSGVTGLVIAGSTGEGSLLSRTLKKDLFSASLAITNKRIPLVAGLGIGGTESQREAALEAKAFGFQGLLASPPAYIKAPQRGLVEHYLSLGAIGLPICLYEIAGRAAVSLQVKTLEDLATSKDPRAKNFVALKDASGDLLRQTQQVSVIGKKWALLSGDDATIAPFVACGGHGVISVVSHLIPKTLAKIVHQSAGGHLTDALVIQNKIKNLVDQTFAESNPIPVKSLLAHQGIISTAEFCAPLVPMTPSLLQSYSTATHGLSELPRSNRKGK